MEKPRHLLPSGTWPGRAGHLMAAVMMLYRLGQGCGAGAGDGCADEDGGLRENGTQQNPVEE